jgi:hypothetical protein
MYGKQAYSIHRTLNETTVVEENQLFEQNGIPSKIASKDEEESCGKFYKGKRFSETVQQRTLFSIHCTNILQYLKIPV